MSIKSDGANFLTITCVRICLKMNQRSSRRRRSVPRWTTELRREILRQRWEDWFLSCLLSNADLHPGIASARNWTRDHPGNEGVTVYPCGVWGPRYGDKFKGGGEIIDSYPTLSDTHLNPEIVWKPPGGRSLISTVFHGRRERGLKGVAVCSSFHTGSIDSRGSWCCVKNHGSMRRAMRGL